MDENIKNLVSNRKLDYISQGIGPDSVKCSVAVSFEQGSIIYTLGKTVINLCQITNHIILTMPFRNVLMIKNV